MTKPDQAEAVASALIRAYGDNKLEEFARLEEALESLGYFYRITRRGFLYGPICGEVSLH